MRKNGRKLVISRETLRTLDGHGLNGVNGGASIAVCGTLAGTTVTTGQSNSYGICTEQSAGCTTGGACTVTCAGEQTCG